MRLFAIFCTGFVTFAASARIVPSKDPLDGVLDAQLVVTVEKSHDNVSGMFQINEVFWGDAKKGDKINLGDFELATEQQSGPPKIDAITLDTRILLFLQPVKGSPNVWEPTYYRESFFWVQRPQDEPLLRRAAERAVELRKLWEAAAAIPDLKQRVAALWPYLSMFTYGVRFFQRTEEQLELARPTSGEYFAEHFDEMREGDPRLLLLPHAGGFGSAALQRKLREEINRRRQFYDAFVSKFEKVPKKVDWNSIPPDLQRGLGEAYYALAGLAGFKDRNDLPYIRETALWAARYDLKQMANAAVDAFRDMPDPKNLPVIERLMKQFLPGQPGISSLDIDVERALCAHTYPETVPLLAGFFGDFQTALANDPAGMRAFSGEVEACLTKIVGEDLGSNALAWTTWYRERNRTKAREAGHSCVQAHLELSRGCPC